MSQELLYTSAPAGLNPSDQGFCTVLSTQGMPRNLKEFLESLSGYRQADQPPHPVNFSHLIHTIGGKRYQILSRVSDYEKDYSGRTNKLAHHVALTIDELPPAGPAALLGTSIWKTSWDGTPRWEPHGPILPSATAYQGPCRHWEQITGDAGWAGLLAESAADGSNRPMYVIFAPGQDVLPLISEAMAVLPREKAWTTSFSTYFTKLPAGVDCLWRFVLDGSPEATQARAASHARTIDLVELQRSHRPAPSGNPYVNAARQGRVMDAPVGTMAGPGTFSPSATAPQPVTAEAVYLLTESITPASPFASNTAAPASPFGKPFGAEQKSSKLPLILGGSAVVLVLGVGALLFFMMTKDIPAPSIASDSTNRRDRKADVVTTDVPVDFESPIDKAKREAAERAAIRNKPKIVKMKAPAPKETNVAVTPKETKVAVKTEAWDQDLKKLDGYLSLPQRIQAIGATSAPEPTKLAEIHVADPKQINVAISSTKGNSQAIDSQDAGSVGLMIQAEDQETDDGQSRKWIVRRKIIDSFTKLPKLAELGTFELAGQNLTFQWNMDAPDWAKANSLQYCILEIAKNDQPQRFRLSKPKSVPTEPYKLESRNQVVDLAVNPNAVEDDKDLMLDVQLLGVDSKAFSKMGLKVGDTAKFDIERKLASGNGRVEFDLTFQYDGKRPFLEINAYTFRKTLLNPNKQNKEELKSFAGVKVPHQIPIAELRFPTNISDFERIADSSEKLSKAFGVAPGLNRMERVDIPGKKRLLSSLEGDLAEARKNGDQKEAANIEGQIASVEKSLKELTDIVDGCHQRIDLLNGQIPWTKEMQPVFEEIGKTARIGYSLYHTINGEKVYLAQTEPEQTAKK